MTATETEPKKKTKKSAPVADLQGACILIHGPAKCGKTTLASSFNEDVVFLMTEAGHRFLPKAQKDRVTFLQNNGRGWGLFKSLILREKLQKAKPKVVVVDTIKGVYESCMAYVCAANDWKHPSDGAHGRGWEAVRREFSLELLTTQQLLAEMDTTFIMIAHSKLEQVQTRSSEYHRFAIDLPGQAHSIVTPLPDYIFHYAIGRSNELDEDAMKRTEGPRTLWVGGNELTEAGTRDPGCRITAIDNVPATGQYDFICQHLYQEAK